MNQNTPLSQRVHAVIADMDRHLTPDDRASVRGAAGQLPLAGYVALAHAPYEWTGGRARAAGTRASSAGAWKGPPSRRERRASARRDRVSAEPN